MPSSASVLSTTKSITSPGVSSDSESPTWTVRRVAKGIARWALFVPALIGELWAFGFFALPSFSDVWWIPLVVALSLLATGVFYLFNSRTLTPTGNSNYSLVGVTPEQAAELGATGSIEDVPSVDGDIDACGALSGDERRVCFEDLDKKLMDEVLPWVPYLFANNIQITGPAVVKWDYDQFSGTTAYAHVAERKACDREAGWR